MLEDSLKINVLPNADSTTAKATQASALPSSVKLIDYQETPAKKDTTHRTLITTTQASELPTDTAATDTSQLNSNFLLNKFGFFSGSRWINENDTVHFVGISGDPVPYKLSNDVFVTGTLLLCLFMASFVVSRSMHAIGLQIKNFFFNRDRNESFSLKSEGEVKNQLFVVVLESFVLSLLFFSYAEFKLVGDFTTVSPYLLLFADMGVCLGYFALKYLIYATFNWTFFTEENRGIWFDSYNLVTFGKAVTMLPLVLIILYFNLSLEVCIYAFIIVIGLYELLILYKTKQIFFGMPFGIVPTILYFCTLELLPLFMLWEVLVKTNEFLLI